jgi:ribosome biogenesis GTPase
MNDILDDKKEHRKRRKEAKRQDRSKYKKSVREKHGQRLLEESNQRIENEILQRGRVVSIFSEQMLVFSNATYFTCTLRGVLKKEQLEAKNLVIVGDYVLFATTGANEGVIWQVEKRKSILAKQSKKGNREQLIAANLDQVLITLAAKEPPFDIAYLDRALIATLRGKMKPLIVINKIDLGLTPEVEECIKIYTTLGIPIIQTSHKTGEGIETLKKKMKNKASVFVGLSGAGKSSLINSIVETSLPTQTVSEKSKQGRHTTTRSSLLHLKFGGFCIDTPGIQDFGVSKLTKQELDDFFSEIAQMGSLCKFFNCTHSHEPQCAVKKACEQGSLSSLRLSSYLSLLQSIR